MRAIIGTHAMKTSSRGWDPRVLAPHRHGASRHVLHAALTAIGLFSAAAGPHAQGRLVAWGDDTSGQVSGTPSGSDFVAVEGGRNITSVALRADGSIVSWGYDG